MNRPVVHVVGAGLPGSPRVALRKDPRNRAARAAGRPGAAVLLRSAPADVEQAGNFCRESTQNFWRRSGAGETIGGAAAEFAFPIQKGARLPDAGPLPWWFSPLRRVPGTGAISGSLCFSGEDAIGAVMRCDGFYVAGGCFFSRRYRAR
jgi:hypothetical protein